MATESGASGSASIVVTGPSSFRYDVSVRGVEVLAAHIHTAPRGVDGPTAVLFTLDMEDGSARGEFTNVAASTMSLLAKGLLYVAVHSSRYPGGELRGQIESVAQHVANTTQASRGKRKEKWEPQKE